MKISCNVIKDLLPLYVEEIATPDTRIVVEEHISSCETCKSELDKLRKSSGVPIDSDIIILKEIQHKMRKKKYLTILCSIMITMAFVITIFGYLTAPEYVPYSKDIVTVMKNNNGTIAVKFQIPISGYQVSRNSTEGRVGYIYNISAWNTLWNQYIGKENYNTYTIIDAKNSDVRSIYYNSNNGSEDILLYGENQNPSGHIVTLPRLVLAYYKLIAIILAFVCGFILIFYHKNKKATNIIIKILFLPLSYLLGQMLIMGLGTSTFSAFRDFCAILLVMVPLYFAMLFAWKIACNRKIS